MILVHCDGGCGKTTKEASEFHEIGLIRSRQYCKDCEESVAEYERFLDALHTEMALEFEAKMRSLRDGWMLEHPEGSLPDVL